MHNTDDDNRRGGRRGSTTLLVGAALTAAVVVAITLMTGAAHAQNPGAGAPSYEHAMPKGSTISGAFSTATNRQDTGDDKQQSTDDATAKPPQPRAPGMWDEPEHVDPPTQSYNIGICLSIPAKATSMYTNGAKQATFFLYELLSYRDRHNVVLINLDSGDPAEAAPEWQLDGIQVVRFDDALAMRLDVVIELGMQLGQGQVDRLQLAGTKVAAYRSGNNFIMTMENMIYNRSVSTMFSTVGYDVLWTLPSFNRSNAFLNLIYQSDVKVAPYLWSPRFFSFVTDQLPERKFYEPTGEPKRIAIFEPNLNVVKTATMPMVIAELLFREDPELIGKVYVTNSNDLAKHRDFISFVQSSMTVYNNKKMYFEKRYKFGWFLSSHTDVVLSHQWDNELNYLFIEALFAGYPLVHNSPYFKDCGYYYEGDDGYMGRDKLREAILTHDSNLDAYNAKARECVWRYTPVNPDNIYEWDRLLDELVTSPRTPEQQERLARSPHRT